jgi:hypothetical protein
VKIGESHAYTQELIGGGEVWIFLIKLGPLIFLMSTRMEHSGECNHGSSIEAVNDMIFYPFLILDVDMELLQVGPPLPMEIILQLPPCLYELQRLVISVDDCIFSQNVMFPLKTSLYNGIHFLVIGGVFLDSI